MKLARVLVRLIRISRWIIWGLWHGGGDHVRALNASPVCPDAQDRVQFWFTQALHAAGVTVRTFGNWSGSPRLVACNHISWLDILVLGSTMPIVFLSKKEISHWPVIRRLAHAGGTLFIKRGTAGAARHSIDEIARALTRRQSVLVFPEGTTGEGRSVMHYHPRLFAAAIEQQIPVQPVALRYPHSQGINPAIPYTGKIWLITSLWRVLSCAEVRAEVHWGEAIMPDQQMERRELADQAHAFTARVVEENGDTFEVTRFEPDLRES